MTDILSYKHQHILIAGTEKLAASISVCMLQAGHQVTVYNPADADVTTPVNEHLNDLLQYTGKVVSSDAFNVVSYPDAAAGYDLAIAITNENLADKIALVHELESWLGNSSPIAINMESIKLSDLQPHAQHPQRLLGVNWVEPAHTTCFLEIITNEHTNQQIAEDLFTTAKHLWNKDPYLLKSDAGIRAKMMGALVREAFYLVENNYVTVEDIDRACRNDAGYYMPFAGNFRYMDLMGTYMYGVVMQDLNPELSKDTHVPEFCQKLIDNGSKGMAGNQGFYQYEPGEVEMWEATFRKFSYQIQQIIHKYPFNYISEDTAVKS
jgi:3-hydroxybutyryl-CoA dehydrogenase